MDRKIKVLIVDKNLISRNVLAESLSQLSCEVHSCSDTQESLGEISEIVPDLLLLNCDTPGLDAEQIIVFAANNPDTKIYLVSSQTEIEEPRHSHGAIKFPVSQNDLEKIISNISHESPILEAKMLLSIQDLAGDDDPDFLNSLINLFFDRAPKILIEIQTAIDNKDSYKMERSAHSLKGSSGNLGAKVMMKTCEELEIMGRNKEIDSAQEILDRLKETFVKTKFELESNWLKKAS